MAVRNADVEQVVREALQAVNPAAATLDRNARLASELGMDSAQVMDLIMEIEDRLDISIPVSTLANAHTLDELCAGIRRLTTA